MKLSIIIPAYNEEKTIITLLNQVLSVPLVCEKEIIVIDDGSSDGTVQLLVPAVARGDIILIKQKKNSGKGAAFKTGVEAATGDLVIIQDADLEYNPIDIPNLLKLMTPDVTAVYGNRGVKRWPKRGFYYVLGVKLLTWTVDLLYGVALSDLYVGYKLVRRADLLRFNLQSSGFELEVEISCKILNAGGKIVETPIRYIPRSREEGKKIGLTDAFIGFWTIFKYRFGR